MPHRDEVVKYMNEYLRLFEYKDYGPMGLQFIGNEEIKKVACAVSVNMETISKASFLGADMLIVHHGLFWNGEPRCLDTRMSWRLDSLEDYQLSLCGYHLCLDAHPEVGNNILAAKFLRFTDIERFGGVGYGGTISNPQSFYDEVLQLYRGGRGVKMFLGAKDIKRAAIVSGKGASLLHEASRQGYDVLVTGEAEEPSMGLAQDLGISLVCAGHNITEELGVKALTAKVAERFDLKWDFIKNDNPV